MSKNNNIQEWYYAHDADITFGEVHVSKLPKIILAIVAVLLTASTICGIIFRHYIHDYIVNPKITFISEVKNNNNTATLEVYSEFDPVKYIDDVSNKYTYTVDGFVDTKQLGTYVVTYISKNKAHINQIKLTVNVVDTTAPVLTLKGVQSIGDTYLIALIRGNSADGFVGTNDFDVLSYIDKMYDNYSKEDKLAFEYSKKEFINFGTTGSCTTEAAYSVTDECGNNTTVRLIITVNDNADELKREQDEQIKKLQEEYEKKLEELRNQQASGTPVPNLPTSTPTVAIVQNPTPTNTVKPNPTNTVKPTQPAVTNTPKPTNTPPSGDFTCTPTPTPEGFHPHMSKDRIVVHNMTELEEEMMKLYVEDSLVGAIIDYSNVNPTVSGTYTAYAIAYDGSYKLPITVIVESDIASPTPKPTKKPDATPTPTPKPTHNPTSQPTKAVRKTFTAQNVMLSKDATDAEIDAALRSAVSYTGYKSVWCDLSTLGFTAGQYTVIWHADNDTYPQIVILH